MIITFLFNLFVTAQVSDSGKFMVQATNIGGEAKSIADCAVVEASPEMMQDSAVKTILYESTPSEFKAEVSFHLHA